MNGFRIARFSISLSRWLTLLLIAMLSRAAPAGEVLESLGHVTTTDGSMLQCMIAHPAPWTITTSSGVQTLKIDAIDFIEVGERIDPNVENEANVAVGDLQNDTFETREKAEAKLRSLGRAAAKALRQAQTAPDVEVVKRARALLAEMGVADGDGLSQDRVHLRDGTVLRGELTVTDVSVRTHFGRMRFPIDALDSISIEKESAAQTNDASFASADSKEIAIPMPAATHSEAAAAHAWTPNTDARIDPDEMNGLEEAQRNALTMDKVADTKGDAMKPKTLVATKPGDRLEYAYADRGVAIHATAPQATVEVSGEKMQSYSAGRSLIAKNSDIEIRFALPGTKGAIAAGVFHIGAIVRTEGPGTIGMAAYDSAGRLLVQTLNGDGPGGPASRDQFIGLQSKTPIARLRVFRAGAMKTQGADLLLDDVVFDRLVGAGLHENQSRVVSLGGDRLVGKSVDAGKDAIGLKVEFLGEQAEALTFKLPIISSYEPARGSDVKTVEEAKDKQPKARRFALAHGVLLQNGETFRAHLFALDDKLAVFGLAHGAVMKLPREMLRKIDLIPEATTPGEAPAPTALVKDEKPGVDFKKKARYNDPAAPQPAAEEKKDPSKNPAQGLPRMDDAQILSVNPETYELTVKDEFGEMTMSLTGIKALVFAPNLTAAVGDKKHAWSLQLRGGSRFDADILRIGAQDISADMAGGTVLLPAETVERIERK